MTAALIAVVALLGLSLTALGAVHLSYRRHPHERLPASGRRRILFPFIASALSPRALDAALRLARAEDATLVPVFLARVSLQLPLDTPLPRQSNIVIPLQEAIERRATRFGIAVDARVERGRTHRHALRQTIDHERFDRIVVAAAAPDTPGFAPADVAWILENAPGEILVLRPDHEEVLSAPATAPLDTARRERRAGSGAARTPAGKQRPTGRVSWNKT